MGIAALAGFKVLARALPATSKEPMLCSALYRRTFPRSRLSKAGFAEEGSRGHLPRRADL